MKIFERMFSVFRKKPKPVQLAFNVASNKVNFKNDFECLFSIISTFIDNEKFKISISQKKILSDNDLLEISEVITNNIVLTLSESYKAVLTRYIAEDELVNFITEIVVRNVVQLALEINKKTL
jgi:hypothetical protein